MIYYDLQDLGKDSNEEALKACDRQIMKRYSDGYIKGFASCKRKK